MKNNKLKHSLPALFVIAAMMSGCAPQDDESSARVESIDDFFSPEGVEVTAATYPSAESSRQFLQEQSAVGVNNFNHRRELTPTDKQTVVRMNRDTYYSFGVANVSEGATLILPDIAEGKYVSGMVITEDHRIHPMFYGPGEYELTTHTGDHVFVAVRLDATFSQQEANAIQDRMQIAAKSSEPFRTEPVDKASFMRVEEELKAKMPGILKRDGVDALVGMFTSPNDPSKEMFTQEKYEVGAAIGWGGAQVIDNIYELSPPYPADVCHQMTFEDPENAAFWSITVYNGAGFMFNDVANVSSDTATPNEDRTYTVSFGCGPDAPNNLETANESGVFTLGIRHYRVGDKVKNGYRLVPAVQAVQKAGTIPVTADPFSTVDTVDSSNWKYNPADMGMTVEQFVNAEGLHIMTNMQNMAGSVNELYHFTELASADTVWVVSPNNDVIYSVGTVDLSEGFAVHLPEDGDRYITLQIVTQEHTASSHVGAGVYEYAKGDFNGTHAIVGIRVGTDGTAEDVKHIVENVQPRMRIVASSAEPVPAYDEELLLKTRAHVIQGYNELSNLNGAAVDKVENITDWERFTYALAGGWGMNFDEISMYSPAVPVDADQNKCYTITFDTPEVNDFWSLTVYNSQNYLMADDYNIVNTGNATLNEDGKSVTVFATNNIADGEKYDNFLLVNEDNWTALVRAYGVKDVKTFANFDAPDWTECR